MEPFSITCHSCAARLKVARAELIGQTLACPQCGSMIHVQHPTGWKPPIPESAGSLSALSSVVGGSDFERIEDLLPKPGETVLHDTDPGSIASETSPSSRSEKARFQKPVPPSGAAANLNGRSKQSRAATANHEKPILPGQQWASPSAQQRKKLILMIGSAIATVSLVAVAIAAIVHFNSASTPPINTQVADADATNNDAPVSPNTSNDELATPPQASPTETNDKANQFLEDEPTSPQIPIEQKDNATQTSSTDLSDLNPSRFAPPEIDVDAPKVPLGETPTDENNSSDDNSNPPPETKTLQDLLADYGISVGELEDVATLLRSYEDSSSPKFSMEPPKTQNLNFQRLLKLPIRKLEAPAGISLAQSTRMINRLSGVPIAIDARQLSLMGLPVNPTFNLALQDETTLSAAEKIAELAGAKATVVGDGIFISMPANEKNSTFKLAFPNVGELNDQQKQGFLDAIQALIAPNAWSRPTTPPTIRFEENTIILNSSTGIKLHVQMLIDRMNAAVEIVADPKSDNAAVVVASRWSASANLRTQPTSWAVGPNLSLTNFLDRVERLHGLTVLVDWPSVLTAGWTPLTQVPGELVEAEVGEAIHRLAKAMKLKVIGIDAKTLQLTTSTLANSVQDLEVYPLLASWANETPPQEIEQLIFTALGRQVQSSFVRLVYEPKCKCLIVVAPQSIQRQVEKLVERLNQAKNDNDE